MGLYKSILFKGHTEEDYSHGNFVNFESLSL